MADVVGNWVGFGEKLWPRPSAKWPRSSATWSKASDKMLGLEPLFFVLWFIVFLFCHTFVIDLF